MTADLGCPYKGLASYEDSEFDVRFFFGRERRAGDHLREPHGLEAHRALRRHGRGEELGAAGGRGTFAARSRRRAGRRRVRCVEGRPCGGADRRARRVRRRRAEGDARGHARGVRGQARRRRLRDPRRRRGVLPLPRRRDRAGHVLLGASGGDQAPGPARELPPRDPRRRARQARPLQGGHPEPLRQLPAACPSRPRSREERHPRPCRSLQRARRRSPSAWRSTRISPTLCSTRSPRAASISARPVEASCREQRSDDRIEAPYLQLVMRRLWEAEEEAGSRTLRTSTLEALGGAEEIVRAHLARALEPLTGEQKDIAAAVFNHLVTPSGTKIAHAVPDLARYAGVSETELEPVLATLARERILRPAAADGGAPRYEIYHDVLGEAVLAWRAAHEAERELVAERERAAGRHRRMLAVLGAGGVLLAVMAGVTVVRARAAERSAHAGAHGAGAPAGQRGRLATDDRPGAQPRARRRGCATRSERADRRSSEDVVHLLARAGDVACARAGVRSVVQPRRHARRRRERGRDRARLRRRDAKARASQSIMAARRCSGPRSRRTGSGSSRPDRTARRGYGMSARHARSGRCGTGRPCARRRSIRAGPSSRAVAASVKIWRAGGELSQRCRGTQPVTGACVQPGRQARPRHRQRLRRAPLRPATGELIRTFDQGGRVTSAAFGPGAALLVTTGANETARIWRVRDGQLLHELKGHRAIGARRRLQPGAAQRSRPRAPTARRGSGRAHRRAACDHWRTQRHRSRRRLQPRRQLRRHRQRRSDGAGLEGRQRRWASILAGHGDSVHTVAFSPDGTRVLTASDDGTARLWDPAIQPQLELVVPGAAATGRGRVRVAGRPDHRRRPWLEGALLRNDGRLLDEIDAGGP